MEPFSAIQPQRAGKIRYVLCDIDDTITTDGKLPVESYAALWRLHDAGYGVIPVTGRPAGWCDLIVRQWPVTAVVGENGAFVYYFREGHRLTFTHPSVAGGDIQGRLAAVRDACLAGVPGCRVSKDQFSRIYDVAIDFNEDPPYLGFGIHGGGGQGQFHPRQRLVRGLQQAGHDPPFYEGGAGGG